MDTLDFPVDHIGIAVFDLRVATLNYQSAFGGKIVASETLLDRGIELVFISAGNTLLELISPVAGAKLDPNNTVQKFLNSRGEGLHHICFKVDDILVQLDRLQKMGHVAIDKTPRAGAFSSKIAFLHPKTTNGVLIELCQR